MGVRNSKSMGLFTRVLGLSALALAIILAMSSDAAPAARENQDAGSLSGIAMHKAKGIFNSLSPATQERLNALSTKLPSFLHRLASPALDSNRRSARRRRYSSSSGSRRRSVSYSSGRRRSSYSSGRRRGGYVSISGRRRGSYGGTIVVG